LIGFEDTQAMRSEHEVFQQLLNYAQDNEMVRAVWLNGSRANPNAPKDIFCDYDVVYAVTEPKLFLNDRSWIRNFGELIILQQNDVSEQGTETYIFLMLFSDGVRIDLCFFPVQHLENALNDSLTVVLLDKDQRIGQLPPPSELDYFIQKPTRREFDEVTNEFWWCSTNVAKGIWRKELCYANYMNEIVRDCLLKMVTWYIGVKNKWAVNTGAYGKWYQKYLPADLWESLVKTYANENYEKMWEALSEAGKLTRRIGIEIGAALGYEYPLEDDRRVTDYLKRVHSLPQDATSFDSNEW
jgi:aminoglycoside 6-adenylyltransferase